MTYEVDNQAPPPKRSRALRRAGVIAALAVGLVAGGFGIASAASSPAPTPTQTPSPNPSTPRSPTAHARTVGDKAAPEAAVPPRPT